LIDLTEATETVSNIGKELTRYAQGLLSERAKRSPYPRDRADVDFLLTRLGRMQQFLKAAYVLAHQDFGSAVAPIARAMWETWIDTAWLLLDAKERAHLFWASTLPKTLALFANFEKYETLNEHNQQTKAILQELRLKEPELYDPWVLKKGPNKGKFMGYTQIRWQGKSIREMVDELEEKGRLGQPGHRPYRYSYDYVYSRLCSVTHGDSSELESLMDTLPDGATIFQAGAGRFDAISSLLSGTGAALIFLAELYFCGYHFGDYSLLEEMRIKLDALRDRHGS